MNVADQLLATLKAAGDRLGRQLTDDVDALRTVVSDQMMLLSAAVNEPGFDEALLASRDIVALESAIVAVDAGDSTDAELLGLLSGGLSIAARALATA